MRKKKDYPLKLILQLMLLEEIKLLMIKMRILIEKYYICVTLHIV